ncbi:Hsp70 family protein [Lacisediminimonas profundi]|uniref:Hsp70 family protein n=1 Tax=Lacisediminimonas profundi TaxID=2603856 RepID=UPI00124B076B|nr:Hsp70 family protein [Lacisediminimonas profundi]
MTQACGVDFGTSNSTVGWHRAGQPALLALENSNTTLPSVVFFNAEDDKISYGRAALANYLAGYEGRMMRSMKSLLGTSLMDGQTEVLGRALPFRALLGQFISELKRRAEASAGRSFERAVLGRPVHFIDDNPQADQLAENTLREIALDAGFREVAFQFEPIAAAFEYESHINREELVLIADIGGGTSDFSLVRLGPDRAGRPDRRDDILGNAGVHLGGTDFDKYLSLSSVMPLLGLGSRLKNNGEMPSSHYFNLATWHTINLAYIPRAERELQDLQRDALEPEKLAVLLKLIRDRAGHWLALRVEEGKILLSDTATAELDLPRMSPSQKLVLERERFNSAIGPLTESVESTVRGLLRDADLGSQSVDTVFFTGGSSGVPLLRERIAAVVPNARRVEGDLFGSIGAGLALDAARRFG